MNALFGNEGQSVPKAALAEHRNRTPFPSQYFQNIDTFDRVFHVVVTKVSYDLAATPHGETLRLAEQQAPLVGGDEYYGEPGASSVRWESDFVPYKPRCDVVLANAHAWAPNGKPARRWQAGLAIDRYRRVVEVTGPRRLKLGMTGISAISGPDKASSVPLRYELAFGGTHVMYEPAQLRQIEKGALGKDDLTPLHEERCPENPVGCGYGSLKYRRHCSEREWPAPQIERPGRPFTGQQNYPVGGIGVIGRHWRPRIALAGTYDSAWKQTRWPLLPANFDFAYWNGAQFQIPYPKGGEGIALIHLTADGERTWRLPGRDVYAIVRFDGGSIGVKPARLDTLVFDLTAMTLHASYRVVVMHDPRAQPQSLETHTAT